MAFPGLQEAKKTHTRDDLRALSNLQGNEDKRFELIDGEIYEMPSGTLLHSFIIQTLFLMLGKFVESRTSGVVFGDGAEYNMPNRDTVIPDVSFVAADRMPPLSEKFMFIAPDLAIEVISPSNKPDPTRKKINGYLDSGTRLVWVVYPEELEVDVYWRQPDGKIAFQTLGVGGTLSGEDVMPGFSVSVAAIFPQQKPASAPAE